MIVRENKLNSNQKGTLQYFLRRKGRHTSKWLGYLHLSLYSETQKIVSRWKILIRLP